jgi:hypothetical protein
LSWPTCGLCGCVWGVGVRVRVGAYLAIALDRRKEFLFDRWRQGYPALHLDKVQILQHAFITAPVCCVCCVCVVCVVCCVCY